MVGGVGDGWRWLALVARDWLRFAVVSGVCWLVVVGCGWWWLVVVGSGS